ncbi:MAG: carbohydrate ABC transporter permease [Treponema sp.]|nr:carbohydrate ABC transporter permease [Treponema sp.]
MKKQYLINFLFICIIGIWLFPLLWLVVTSLQQEKDVMSSAIQLFPRHPTFYNYIKAFSSTQILVWLANSFIVSFVTTLATIILDVPIAYAFARIRFAGRTILFWLVMAAMMIPFQVIIIPLYTQFNSYGILNTLAAVLLPRLAMPIGVFIIKQFYEDIPYAIEEAAFIDGANRFQTFFRIMVPLGKAAIVTTIIISFINAWNDFLWPLIAVNESIKYTITVGIANFQGTRGTEYAMIMAGAAIASIPQFIFFGLFRKQIAAGLAATGIKG